MLFSGATLLLPVLLLVAGLLSRQAPLFFLGLALLLAVGLSQLWERRCLAGLEYRRHLSRQQTEFGGTVELELEIVNRKILPLAWLEVEEEVPRQLAPTRGAVYASHKAERMLVACLTALRPYERVRRRYPIPCLARGEHHFGPVRLRTGDLFGLVSRETVLEGVATLVVYPRLVPLGALGLPAHSPLGDLRRPSWLFEDPSRLAGVREHRPGDSLRRVHWPATARTQRLQAKVYEATTRLRLLIFLDLESVAPVGWATGYDPDVGELSIMTAASLAAWGLGQGYQVGLVTNGLHHMSRARVEVAASSDPGQLARLLTALGRLQLVATRPLASVLAEHAPRLPFGSSIVVVAAGLAAPAASQLIALRRRGYPVALLLSGRQPVVPKLDGVAVRRVGPPEGWRDMAALT